MNIQINFDSSFSRPICYFQFQKLSLRCKFCRTNFTHMSALHPYLSYRIRFMTYRTFFVFCVFFPCLPHTHPSMIFHKVQLHLSSDKSSLWQSQTCRALGEFLNLEVRSRELICQANFCKMCLFLKCSSYQGFLKLLTQFPTHTERSVYTTSIRYQFYAITNQFIEGKYQIF